MAQAKNKDYSGKGLGGMGSAGGMGGTIREDENVLSTDDEDETPAANRDDALLRQEQKKRGQYPLHDEPIGGG